MVSGTGEMAVAILRRCTMAAKTTHLQNSEHTIACRGIIGFCFSHHPNDPAVQRTTAVSSYWLTARQWPRSYTVITGVQGGDIVKEFWTGQRLLVVAPHADDEAYGCAGTIAKAKAMGGDVFVIVGSVGNLQHYNQGQPTVTGETRTEEVRASMELLGVDGYEILYTETDRHLRLDAVPQRDLIRLLERDAAYAIDKVRPTVILLPAPSFNQDHRALFQAGFAACRPHARQQKPFVNHVLSCDAVQLGWREMPFHPDVYVDISEYLDVKLQALSCHRSQLRPDPDLGSLENVERLARLRGAEIGVSAAEAFECHRVVL